MLEERAETRDAAPVVRMSSPDCVKIIDGEGRIRAFNPDGLRLMELDDESGFRDRYWPDLWPEAVRPATLAALAGARVGGVASFVAQSPTARGNWRWWDVTVAAIPGADRFCVISRDITEQRRGEEAEHADEERRRMALAGSGVVGLWDWMVDTDLLHGDEVFAHLYGLDVARTAAGVTEAEYQEFVVAEDLAALRASIRAVFDRAEDFLVEYRLAVPGRPLRWVECKGRLIEPRDGGRARFSGTAVDVTPRKRAEEQKHLLMQEMSHRVKNSFALVQAVVFQTMEGADPDLAAKLQARLAALSCAHEVLLQTSWAATTMLGLLEKVLWLDVERDRFVLDGPDFAVEPEAALSLSLLLHELATNAVKYGALSSDAGRVTIGWTLDDARFRLSWQERGGPPVAIPARTGFGSRLIAMGVCGSRDADLRFDEEGLCAIFGVERGSVEASAHAGARSMVVPSSAL